MTTNKTTKNTFANQCRNQSTLCPDTKSTQAMDSADLYYHIIDTRQLIIATIHELGEIENLTQAHRSGKMSAESTMELLPAPAETINSLLWMVEQRLLDESQSVSSLDDHS